MSTRADCSNLSNNAPSSSRSCANSSREDATKKGILLNGVKKNEKGEILGLDDLFTRQQAIIVLFRMWMLSKEHKKDRETATKDSKLLKDIADAKAGEKFYQEYADALLWALKAGIVKRGERKTAACISGLTP